MVSTTHDLETFFDALLSGDGRSLTMLLASGKGDGFIPFAAATGAAYCLT